MDIASSFLIGGSASFFAALMFVLFLKRFKPRLEVSSKIASEKATDGTRSYRIKVINRTPRTVIDLKAELHLIVPISVPGGMVN